MSELEEEEDDEYLLCTINATYALLSPDEESEISEWLKEQVEKKKWIVLYFQN